MPAEFCVSHSTALSVVSAPGQAYPTGHGPAWDVGERTIRRYLYNRALAMGDVRAALAASDSEAKLLGLFDPKAAPPAKTNDITALTDEQLEVMIRGGTGVPSGDATPPPLAKSEGTGPDAGAGI